MMIMDTDIMGTGMGMGTVVRDRRWLRGGMIRRPLIRMI